MYLKIARIHSSKDHWYSKAVEALRRLSESGSSIDALTDGRKPNLILGSQLRQYAMEFVNNNDQ